MNHKVFIYSFIYFSDGSILLLSISNRYDIDICDQIYIGDIDMSSISYIAALFGLVTFTLSPPKRERLSQG